MVSRTIRSSLLLAAAALAAPALSACHEKPALPPLSPDPIVTLAPESQGARSPRPSGDSIMLSDDLLAKCGIVISADGPHFDYDSAALRPRGQRVLDGLASCLRGGPLARAALSLVGHADPRGTEEYNDALARARATAVAEYLHERGVADARLDVRSRGESDAVGTDEASWAHDRRVDISLASRTGG
ncbi:MAG: OmpA family protein [Myxococcales bacterium]|nr:OmpA family protein [Myxococcales bacterium]